MKAFFSKTGLATLCVLGAGFAATQTASADVCVYHRWGWWGRPCVVVAPPRVVVPARPVFVATAPAVYVPHASVVVNLQSRLKAMGYYDGPVDGVVGPGTHAAIARYQRANGLVVTGEMNAATISTLRL